MLLRRLAFVFIIAFLSNACIRKVTNIHLDEDAGVPILFSALRNGDSIRVFTGYTAGIFEYGNMDDYVERNASIVLFRNGTAVDTAVSGHDDYYYFHSLPQPGTEYHIEARFPGGQVLSGNTTFPASLPVQVTDMEVLQSNNHDVVRLRIHIDDPPGPDYYLFVVQPNVDYGSYSLMLSPDFPQPPGSKTFDLYNYGSEEILALSDRAFDGQRFDVDLYYDSYGDPVAQGVIFFQGICDVNYYEYLNYLNAEYYFDDPFSSMEHENPHGNVEGGYGFVGSLLQRTDTIVP